MTKSEGDRYGRKNRGLDEPQHNEPLDALREVEALDRAKELADQVAKVWSKASGGLEFNSDIFDEIVLDASKTGFHILVTAKAHGEQAKRGWGS